MRAAGQSSGKRAVDAQQPKAPVTGIGKLEQVEREGAPGDRGGGFYAGYVRDPDGNKLNAFFMG
jgi:hypothetical protein